MVQAGWVDLGYVARTHGVRGTLIVHWHDSIAELTAFPVELGLTRRGQPMRVFAVAQHRPHRDATLVDFEHLTDRDEAALWRGAQVAVREAHLPTPDSGEVYLYQLMQRACVDEAGRSLGVLTHIYSHGGPVVLGITDDQGHEHLLPLHDDTLRSGAGIPASANTPVVLKVPEGLWEK